MINFDLHCNISECRALLQHQAVVTKCTHIFCVSCAAAVNLTAGRRTDTFNHPACPACEATLSGPDDAVMTVLNPTDAYKDSVLSGLSPDLIMEIAQKGLKFWAYQASMELNYQNQYAKSVATNANNTLEQYIYKTSTEITSLERRITEMRNKHEAMVSKNQDLSKAYKEKCKKAQQIQDLYDQLVRKSLMSQNQAAASNDVEGLAMEFQTQSHQGQGQSQGARSISRMSYAGSEGSERSNEDRLRNGFNDVNTHGIRRTGGGGTASSVGRGIVGGGSRARGIGISGNAVVGENIVRNITRTPTPSKRGTSGPDFAIPHRQQVTPALSQFFRRNVVGNPGNYTFIDLESNHHTSSTLNNRQPLGLMSNGGTATRSQHIGVNSRTRIGRTVPDLGRSQQTPGSERSGFGMSRKMRSGGGIESIGLNTTMRGARGVNYVPWA